MSTTDFSTIPNIPALPAVVRDTPNVQPQVSAEMQNLQAQAQAAVDFLTRTPEGEATHRSAAIHQAGGTTIPKVFAALASIVSEFGPAPTTPARTTSRGAGRTA